MKVICAGLSKTGTKSMAKALRLLGYTVYDFLEHRDYHIDDWLDIYCNGKQPDFASMYQRVDAVTGLPAAFWFEEISEAFPQAKVVLTIRHNEEIWMRSWAKLYDVRKRPGGFLTNIMSRAIRWLPKHQKTLYFVNVFEIAAFGTTRVESTFLRKKKYREHNQRVQAVIPREKLLVYNVKQGWKPLCEFLGCNVPNQPFPRENVASSWVRKVMLQRVDEEKFKLFVCIVFLFCLLTVIWHLIGNGL